MRRYRIKTIWSYIIIAVISAGTLGTYLYYSVQCRALPITRKALGATITLMDVQRKPNGQVVVKVNAESATPDLVLGRLMVDGKKCIGTQETTYLTNRRKIFQDLECKKHLMFNTAVVTQQVFLEHRAKFSFLKVNPAKLPLTRKVGGASVTLSSVFIDKPGSSTWPLGENSAWDGIKESVLVLLFSINYPNGYTQDAIYELTDDRGNKYSAIASGRVSGDQEVYLFKGFNHIPAHISIELSGTLPPENVTLVRFPRVRVSDAAY